MVRCNGGLVKVRASISTVYRIFSVVYQEGFPHLLHGTTCPGAWILLGRVLCSSPSWTHVRSMFWLIEHSRVSSTMCRTLAFIPFGVRLTVMCDYLHHRSQLGNFCPLSEICLCWVGLMPTWPLSFGEHLLQTSPSGLVALSFHCGRIALYNNTYSRTKWLESTVHLSCSLRRLSSNKIS